MKKLAVQKVRDVDANVRAWLTRLFGGTLPEDAEIHVELRQPGEPPQSGDDMRRIMNAMSDLSGPPADELEAALKEAMKPERRPRGAG
jgi:hypothetical protein